MASDINKEFENLHKLLGKVLRHAFDKYTNIRKIFNNRFHADWSSDVCAARGCIDSILSEIDSAILLNNSIDVSSSNSFVDTVIKNNKEYQVKIEAKIQNLMELLKKINSSDIL